MNEKRRESEESWRGEKLEKGVLTCLLTRSPAVSGAFVACVYDVILLSDNSNTATGASFESLYSIIITFEAFVSHSYMPPTNDNSRMQDGTKGRRGAQDGRELQAALHSREGFRVQGQRISQSDSR